MANIRTRYIIGAEDQTGRGVASAIGNLKKLSGETGRVTSVFKSLVPVLSLYQLGATAKNTLELVDATGKLAQKIGVSVKEFSALSYAAEISDVSMEQLGSSLLKLSRNMVAAAGPNGSEKLKAAFSALKINIENTDGSLRSSTDVLGDLADRFSNFKDGPEKAALAIQLFGRSGAQLIPFLNAGREAIENLKDEARRLGVVFDEEAAKAADELNDNLGRMKFVALGASAAIVNDLAPGINELVKNFRLASAETTGVIGFFNRLGSAISMSASDSDTDKLASLVTRQKELWQTLKEVNKGGDKQAAANIQTMLISTTRQIQGLRVVTEDMKKATTADAAKANAPKIGDTAAEEEAAKAAKAAAEAAKKITDERQRLIESEVGYITGLEKQLALQQDLSEEARVQFELQKGEGAAFTEAGKAAAISLSRRIDLMKESKEVQDEMSKAVEEREKSAIATAESFAERRKAAIESLRTPMEQYADTVRELSLLDLGQDNMARGIAKAREEMDRANDSASNAKETIRDLGLTFTSAFESAISEGAAFGDIIRSLEKDLIQLGTRKFVTEPFLKGFEKILDGAMSGGGGGGISGFIGKLFAGGKATGGDVSAGRIYRVGELGPEMIMMGGNGKVIPNNAMGNVTVNLHYAQPPRNDQERASAMQVAAQAGRHVQKAVSRYT